MTALSLRRCWSWNQKRAAMGCSSRFVCAVTSSTRQRVLSIGRVSTTAQPAGGRSTTAGAGRSTHARRSHRAQADRAPARESLPRSCPLPPMRELQPVSRTVSGEDYPSDTVERSVWSEHMCARPDRGECHSTEGMLSTVAACLLVALLLGVLLLFRVARFAAAGGAEAIL